MRHKHLIASLIAFSATVTMLGGCGISSSTGPEFKTGTTAVFDALSSKGLRQGFKDIHAAIFAKIDSNSDGSIDEFEAGPHFDLLRAFPAAAKGQGKISKSEFVTYATAGGFLSNHDTPTAFMQRMRDFLAKVFQRLDKPAPNSGLFAQGDGYLSTQELSDKAVAKLGLGFAYERIRFQVGLSAFDSADVTAADVTGDGKLSQAEFEDLYMKAIVKAINPTINPGPAPAPPASGDVPVVVNWLNI